MKASLFSSPLALVSLFSVLFFASCAEKNKDQVKPETTTEDHSTYVAPDQSSESPVVSNEIIENLKTEGMSIHSGALLPDVSGSFDADQFIPATAFSSADPSTDGIPSIAYRFKISRGSGDRISLEYISLAGETGFVTDAYMTGLGRKFTIYGNMIDGGKSFLVVLSGEMMNSQISNLEYALVQSARPRKNISPMDEAPQIIRIWRSERAVRVLPTTPMRKSPPVYQISKKNISLS